MREGRGGRVLDRNSETIISTTDANQAINK
jgi:hypothetical protein